MKKEFLDKIEGLEKQLADLKKEALADDSTAFKKGWYIIDTENFDGWLCLNPRLEGVKVVCDATFDSDLYLYKAGALCDKNLLKHSRPATPTEIQSALVAEAKKRGFKGGVRVNRNFPGNTGIMTINGQGLDWEYFPPGKCQYSDRLKHFGVTIYQQGQWAEIIAEPQVTIAGHKVEYSGECCYINSTQYKKEDLQTLAFLLKNTDVKSLNVGCTGQYKVSHEHIKHILDNWK